MPVFLNNIKAGDVCVACINSPLNCTLSGPEASIDAVKAQADKDGIFALKLRTGVAYHSPSMLAISDEYLLLMGTLEGAGRQDTKASSAISMVSSVTGKAIQQAELVRGQYWVDNMVSPVRFADAIQVLTQESSRSKLGMGNITDLVEIGPHPALRRPVFDTIGRVGNRRKHIRYFSALHRSHLATSTMLDLVGQLFCLGHAVSITVVNQQSPNEHHPFLVDCPEYPFDHSNKYWSESRISRDYRLRGTVKGETLGTRVTDWNELAPRWRKFLSIESASWIGHHLVSDTVLYPAAGMLVMAIEAVQQMISTDRTVAGFLVKEASFVNPIIVGDIWEDRTETQVHLRPMEDSQNDEGEFSIYKTTIFAYRGRWTECFHATIHIDYESPHIDDAEEKRLGDEVVRDCYRQAADSCDKPIDSSAHYSYAAEHGLQYGDSFSILQNIRWDDKSTAVARVDVTKERYRTSSLVHPTILDTAFHVLRVSAGSQPAANVPVRLVDAWFASSGWQTPRTDSVRWVAVSTPTSTEGAGHGEQGTVCALADDGAVLCTIKKAVTAAVAKTSEEQEKKLLYGIEWKPQLSLLDPMQLSAVCHADACTRDETVVLAHHARLCSALDLCAARTLKAVDHSNVPEALLKHVQWMQHHVATNMSEAARQEAETLSDAEVEARLSEVDDVLPAWKLYTECARKLPEILAGELDPLQVVFGSDLATIFYEDLFLNLCSDGRLARLLDLASHENPSLRFLEVGAGTGGMTGHIMKALQEREKRTGSPGFAEYTYTDISPVFFERAKSRWPSLQDRMTFKTLDLDRSIEDQGFKPGSYDYIIAASVLHATPHLEANIRNISKALKPGGRLILLEVINPDDIATNFMAGLVPGWWVAREEWRPHSAAIPEDLWDGCLKRNGFSGNDVVIRDFESSQCHIMSIIVSTALNDERKTDGKNRSTGNMILVVDEQSEQQRRLANILEKGGYTFCFNLDEVQTALRRVTKDVVVICLVEVNKPVLSTLSEQSFKCLQHLLEQAPNLLWVTATSKDDEQYPDYGIMQGFFRSYRAEQPDNHIVTLALEGQLNDVSLAQFISKVVQASFGPQSTGELEYMVRDGHVLTGRAVEAVSGNGTVRSLLSRQLQYKEWAEGPALQLSVGIPGNLNALRFVRDTVYETKLGPHDVEIEAMAWGLMHRDVLSTMGRLEGQQGLLGGDCGGVVTRVGRDCSPLIQPGDRVCMVTLGCMRKFPRALETSVIKIPDSMPFETATSVLVPGMTAYNALVEIGRLEDGDKVLIHSAADAMGQMAVQIARTQGAEIFATASTSEMKRYVVETLGIPEDHIFNSRTTSFAKGVMRVTRGEGVDVLFNSLYGDDALRASCECMAQNGRFVEISRANIETKVTLPKAIFAKNISFSALDVMSLSPKVTLRLLKKTTELMSKGKIQPPQPLQVFKASEIEKAFRDLQDGKYIGRIVITPKPEDVVPVSRSILSF